MPIPFTCPHCGFETVVAEQYAGQSGPCTSCGKPVTVPPLDGAPGYTASSSPGGSGGAVVAIIVIVVLGVVAVLGCVGVFAWVGFNRVAPGPMPVPMATPMPASPTLGCDENLRQIGMAMQQYHNEYGNFPASSVTDPTGDVEHSWRVVLLRYLGESELHDMYDFDQPWGSPENQDLANSRPAVFGCPEYAALSATETSYVMVVRMDMDASTPLSLAELEGDLSQIPLVVEVGASGIHWMQPQDMTVEEIADQVRENTKSNGGYDPYCDHSGYHVLMANGSVERFADAASLIQFLDNSQ